MFETMKFPRGDSHQYSLVSDAESNATKDQSRKSLKLWAYFSTIINIVLVVAITAFAVLQRSRFQSPLPTWPSTLYSPAYHVIQYETVRFNRGFSRNDSIYFGPPDDESDAAWEALWEPTLFSQIPLHEAAPIPENSIPVAGTGTAIVGLDVFHQLHCLNALRKNLRPDYYAGKATASKIKDVAVGIDHLDHCVETLRQSLICNADISPVRWEMTEKKEWATTSTDHICRDWNRITEWATAHILTHHLDGKPIARV